jgi:hypothetical protein
VLFGKRSAPSKIDGPDLILKDDIMGVLMGGRRQSQGRLKARTM